MLGIQGFVIPEIVTIEATSKHKNNSLPLKTDCQQRKATKL